MNAMNSLKPNLLKISWRNVLLNWRHSMAALLSIAAGFTALSLFQGYIADVQSMYEETFSRRQMLGHILIEKPGSQSAALTDSASFSLQPKEQKFLEDFLSKQSAEVINHTRFLNLSGMITNGRSSTIFVGYGYDVKAGEAMRGPVWKWNTIAGKPLASGSSDSVLLGKGLAAVMDCKPVSTQRFMNGVGGYKAEDRAFKCASNRLQLNVTTDAGQVNAVDAEMSGLLDGIFKEVDSKLVVLPLEQAQKLMDTQAVSLYAVELKHPELATQFITRLNEAARAQGLEFASSRWQEHPYGEIYAKTMELLGIFRSFVVTVILTIAGLSVLNTLVKIVTERTREIGTLRSLGFRRPQIVMIFTAEAVFLAVLGNLIGLAASALITAVLNHAGIIYQAGMLSEPVPFRIGVLAEIYVTSAVSLSLIAVLAALWPARKSSRIAITEALAHT